MENENTETEDRKTGCTENENTGIRDRKTENMENKNIKITDTEITGESSRVPGERRLYKHTRRDAGEQNLLQNRISRMIGQLNGIKNMIDDNRYCGDILIQIGAVESALRSLGYIILQEHMQTCVVEEVMKGNETIMEETVELIKKLK